MCGKKENSTLKRRKFYCWLPYVATYIFCLYFHLIQYTVLNKNSFAIRLPDSFGECMILKALNNFTNINLS